MAWYRKHFNVPVGDQGRQLYLDIDGAMAYANVWLNGQYVGGWPYGYASWRVDLTPYVKFGTRDAMKTAGPAAKLLVQADRTRMAADGQDLSFVTITVVDKAGLLVPQSKNPIRFSIKGPGRIVATDNGDATSFESFQSTEHSAFNGLCLAIVQGKPGQAGTITLKAESEGLKTATITLRSQAKE